MTSLFKLLSRSFCLATVMVMTVGKFTVTVTVYYVIPCDSDQQSEFPPLSPVTAT